MKLYRLFFYIIFCSHIALATPSHDLEEISIYSPNGRFGFDGSIVNITLENVQDGPKDRYFSLNENPELPYTIPKTVLIFDENTQYSINRSNGNGDPNLDVPLIPQVSSAIKYRISTYAIARLTLDSYLECGVDPSWFNSLNIILNPDDRVCSLGIGNAYYQRTNSHGTGRIELCSTVNDLSPLPTARFFDIVSHEGSVAKS